MIWLILPILNAVLSFRDDRELVRRLKAREAQAMADLYDRYGRLAYSVILRIVRDSGAAEDLMQEAFLRIWTRIAAFDDNKGALGPWVVAVARNRAIDYLRSVEGRLSRSSVEMDKLDRPGLFADIDEQIVTADHLRRLKGAFEKLTAKQREVIELAYFQGLSQSEMAERMQQPLGTVKTWVRTALRQLREEMNQAATA
jgi:RNA polymerase sigma-70 factor (ECF subfamily)